MNSLLICSRMYGPPCLVFPMGFLTHHGKTGGVFQKTRECVKLTYIFRCSFEIFQVTEIHHLWCGRITYMYNPWNLSPFLISCCDLLSGLSRDSWYSQLVTNIIWVLSHLLRTSFEYYFDRSSTRFTSKSVSYLTRRK